MSCFRLKPRDSQREVQITKNFSLDEMIFSDVAIRNGILNLPNTYQRISLERLCKYILQPIRDHYKRPVIVLSGYRCPLLNTLVNGSKDSQHMRGEVGDIIIRKIKPRDIWTWLILYSGLDYDQVILEFNIWIHVSFSGRRRKKNTIARHSGGKVVYQNYTKEQVIEWNDN